ncbi:hypothetical protein [Rheinheimera sp.]|uniref:hypothetical protein n=1 Tax=Rheinheimera sp. TaxID=1869214 RepID=UPI00307CE4D8
MLKQYLELQQQNLLQMAERQHQLAQHSQQEERRLQLLTGHIQQLERSYQMKSALGLQNLASMQNVLWDMQQQQQDKVQQSQQELQQQQQVCRKQAAFSKGIECLVERRELVQQEKQQRQEQQQADELAMQLHQRGRQLA